MPKYTFDTVLTASITVDAPNADIALHYLRDVMQCANCNGGAWTDGSPVLFEASMNQRPNLAMIDGEDDGAITLNDWDELRKREQGNG